MFDRSMPLFDRSAGSQDHNTRGSDDPSGVLEHLFDREGWNDMASVLRDINETQLSGGGEGGPASPMKAYHMESEVRVEQANIGSSTLQTYKRRQKMGRDEDVFQEPLQLGCQLVMLDLADKVPSGSAFLSPFKDPNPYCQPLDAEKAMKLLEIITTCPATKDLEVKTLLRTKPVYRLHVDTVSSNRVDLANSFVDGKQFETPYIEIFGHCLRLDDNELYPNCSGYRVMLPVTLSVRFSGSNPVISSNGQQL